MIKRAVVFTGIFLAGLVALAFIADALTAKPQREILIDLDYRPSQEQPRETPPSPNAPAPISDYMLTPIPE